MSTIPEMQEKDLLVRIAAGDQAAFTEIYRQYSGRIYTVAIGYLENESDADELLQEIFIKVWEKRDKLRTVNDFKSWLFITARNTIYDHFSWKNAESKRREEFSKRKGFTIEDTSHRAEDYQYARILDEAIDKLPPQQKKVYEYAKLQDLPTAEIAVKMGISKNTVQNHLKSANVFVRSYVKDHLDLLLLTAIFIVR